jgi:hypothetical protein
MPILVRLISRIVSFVDFVQENLDREEEIEVIYHFYTDPQIDDLEL